MWIVIDLLHCLCLLKYFFKCFKTFKHFRIDHLNDLFKVQCTYTEEEYFYVHLALQTTLLVFKENITGCSSTAFHSSIYLMCAIDENIKISLKLSTVIRL
jgi:hypothetical protein